MSIEELLHTHGIKANLIFGGFSGAVVSLVANKRLTFMQSVITIICGVLSSGYITPGISEYFHLSRSGENMLAFFIGIGGMYVIIGIIRFWEGFSKNPVAAIKSLFTLRLQYFQPETKEKNDSSNKPTT